MPPMLMLALLLCAPEKVIAVLPLEVQKGALQPAAASSSSAAGEARRGAGAPG